MMVEPCYNIPKVNDSLLGTCQRPQTEPYLPLTHSVIEPAGSYGLNGTGTWTAVWTCWRAFCFMPSTKWAAWYMGQSNTPKEGMCSFQNPNGPTKILSWWWEGPDIKLILHLKRTISSCPLPLDSCEFHWGRRPLSFCWIHFSSSDVHLCALVQSGCYLLFTWSSQNNATSIVDQCDIVVEQMIKIPSN